MSFASFYNNNKSVLTIMTIDNPYKHEYIADS